MALVPSSSHGSTVTPLAWTDVVGGVGLVNGWVALGSGYQTPGYALDSTNSLLYLRGGIAGTSATDPTAFTLPLAYRAGFKRALPVFNLTTVVLLTTGEVQADTGSAFCVLDGIVVSL